MSATVLKLEAPLAGVGASDNDLTVAGRASLRRRRVDPFRLDEAGTTPHLANLHFAALRWSDHLIRAFGDARAGVPIVGLTASVLPEQRAEIRAAGMDECVGKPFKREALLDAIDRWTADDPLARPAPPIQAPSATA